MKRVGVISDTHGLLRPEAVAFLRGCDSIIHAGDITDAGVIDALQAIAPLTVVRGNNDRGAWTRDIAVSELIRIEAVHVYVIHDIADIEIDPAAAGVSVVVSGHSHRPSIQSHGDMVYVQAGAGLVADSVPELEYQECVNKARAALRAVVMARTAGAA